MPRRNKTHKTSHTRRQTLGTHRNARPRPPSPALSPKTPTQPRRLPRKIQPNSKNQRLLLLRLSGACTTRNHPLPQTPNRTVHSARRCEGAFACAPNPKQTLPQSARIQENPPTIQKFRQRTCLRRFMFAFIRLRSAWFPWSSMRFTRCLSMKLHIRLTWKRWITLQTKLPNTSNVQLTKASFC